MAFQRNPPKTGEGFKKVVIYFEYISIVEIEGKDLSVLDVGSGYSFVGSIFEAPLCTMFGELAIEHLYSGFGADVFVHLFIISYGVVVEP